MATDDYTAASKVCTKCSEEKPLDGFHRAARGKFGRVSVCKMCSHTAYKERYAKHGAEISAKYLAKYHERQEPKRRAKREAMERYISDPNKRCAKCGLVKSKSEFGRMKTTTDGCRAYCKACHNAANRKWRKDRPEVAAEASARWSRENKDRVAARARRYYRENPEKYRQAATQWRRDNPEKSREMYRATNQARRRRPEVRIHESIGNRLRGSLRSGKDSIATFDILDYTLAELMEHLERQFTKGMSWDNYGEWHIDHITPLSSFSISGLDDPELKRAWCLTNLRPLWARDNLSKNCKITHLL